MLPAVVTDRVRPGNCFVPFHWNDEHGEYLTVNALTNDAVDPDSLQPEFKVCAVSPAPGRRHPTLSEHEKFYVAGFFSGLAEAMPMCRCCPHGARQRRCRLWVNGLLAGAIFGPADDVTPPATDRPLVLWASQTGNAEDFAARLAEPARRRRSWST